MTSSMQRDAAAGREIELDAIGGAVLRVAERHGTSIPKTRLLVDDLREPTTARSWNCLIVPGASEGGGGGQLCPTSVVGHRPDCASDTRRASGGRLRRGYER